MTSIQGFFDDCLILADDFRQYYLGAYERISLPRPGRSPGSRRRSRASRPTSAAARTRSTRRACSRRPATCCRWSEFPQFASRAAAEYNPFVRPVEGERYAGAVHVDDSYMRLTRTVDLTGVTAAQAPQLQFALNANVEEGYDHVIVEAHTVGQENWTTLRDLNGATATTPPSECTATGFLLNQHPFLRHYIGGATCAGAGTSGTWNAFTGSTGGYVDTAFDLSAYAGQQVEISIAYVTDPSTGGVGAFVDDTRVVAGGTTLWADGFEGATSLWAPGASPAGSPPPSGGWEIGGQLVKLVAGTATDDTLLLGFGLEQLETGADRAALLEQALGELAG